MFCGKPGTFWPLCGFLPPVQYIRTADGLSTKKCGEIFAKSVDRRGRMWYYFSCAERAPLNARVVELVDSLASGASARKGVRVRLPPRAPRRSKLHIACSDFFQKSERAHCAAPPFQIEPASLGFDLVLGAVSKENRFYPLIIQRDIRKDVPFALSIVAKTVFFFGCNLIFHGKKFLADSTLASPA